MEQLTMRAPGKGSSKPNERTVGIDKSTILGKGGEAIVHRDPEHQRSRAIKRYKKPSTKRAKKLQWFIDNDLELPDRIMVPQELALDAKGKVVGFGMRQLSRRFEKFKKLFEAKFCRDNNITTQVVADLLLSIGRDLKLFFSKNVSVGDLNDGALLWMPGKTDAAWVDVDSWNVEGFPCIVGTKMYLVPSLYGVDLSKGGSHFEPWHDVYSYSLLAVRALLRKHPYKAGKHKEHASPMTRAQNGLHIFHPEVTYPPVGLRPDVLSDELTDIFIKLITGEMKGDLDLLLDTLQAYRNQLTECTSCGAMYPATRGNCPQCSAVTTAPVMLAVGVDILDLIETRGRFLHLQMEGTNILSVAEENGALVQYRSTGTGPAERREVKIGFQPSMRFGFFDGLMVISTDTDENSNVGGLSLLEATPSGPKLLSQLSTNVFAGKAPVFATSKRYLYRTAGNRLLFAERMGAKEIAEEEICGVFQEQCWFTCDSNPKDREILFGLNRDIAKNHWFVSVSDKDGRNFETHPVEIPELDDHESMVDLRVRFSGNTILLLRRTKKLGDEFVRIDRIRIDVTQASSAREERSMSITSSETLSLDDHPQWESISDVAFAGGTVMHSTDEGILQESLKTHATQPLDGSQPVTSSDTRLHVYGKGIVTAGYNRVSLVSKK